MVKIDFKKAISNITKELEASIKRTTDRNSMQKYAKFLAGEIKLRTRLGYGVEENEGEKKRLAPLAKSTKTQRQARKDKGRLSNSTDPNKSNLTQTGQLLDALDGRATGSAQAEVFLRDQRSADSLTNTELAGYHEEGKGKPKRIFMRVSKQELKRLTDQIRKDLIANLRRG